MMHHPSPSSSFTSVAEFNSENLTLTLIPGLPDDLAALILAFLPYSYHGRLKSICRSWKYFFSSRILHSIRRKHIPFSKRSHLLCIFPQDPSVSSPYIFDPQNLAWCYLPPMPCNPHVYGLCNFTSVSHDSHLYVLGGSLFDTRSFPLDRPSPSSSAFRYDFVTHTWDSLPPMLSPRGSFACAAIPNTGRILVAGGGSRHTMFGAAGSRMSSVEMYDIGRNEWMALDGLPRFRAGCVGFMVGNGDEEKEFWVMGGYGESRTILGVFPVDEIYRDAVVMKLKNGGVGKWRELGDMWEEGERSRLGRIAIVEDTNGGSPGIFMLDKNDIFRYDMASNRWWKETSVPKRAADESSVGFVALDGELQVMALHSGADPTKNRRPRRLKRSASLFLQIYHPEKKIWRTLITKPPFQQPLDFKTAVMCTIRL
ncbi:F-box/kelch-repeat protein OR23-like [Cynara cardunculus var. scolymus]|uniref:F-box domain, cyclin-like protein n=1 Tax=Cynara cardunculus var. scolymus TaxID=59895 RepID=A0A103XP47_CYNCS|nr:F-box/kelch-repeat protein OR23-like [Cynara cardunculus var. scolymus]KVH94328.1 F-box domain, cyclin-like protein [Cynara cardunculus var. scolymus]